MRRSRSTVVREVSRTRATSEDERSKGPVRELSHLDAAGLGLGSGLGWSVASEG